MRHARTHPTLTVRRSATCLMVRSRGAAPVECDCPIDFFITPPVQIASRILLRSRRAAFHSDPAQDAVSRADGQHWLRQSVLGTPWRDHPPQQQRSANTRATLDENKLGRTSRVGFPPNRGGFLYAASGRMAAIFSYSTGGSNRDRFDD